VLVLLPGTFKTLKTPFLDVVSARGHRYGTPRREQRVGERLTRTPGGQKGLVVCRHQIVAREQVLVGQIHHGTSTVNPNKSVVWSFARSCLGTPSSAMLTRLSVNPGGSVGEVIAWPLRNHAHQTSDFVLLSHTEESSARRHWPEPTPESR